MIGASKGDGPAWDRAARDLDHACVDPAALARVLRALDLARLWVGRRGAAAHWPPAYRRFVPWRRRMMQSGSMMARGWRAGEWSAEAARSADEADAREREAVAAQNRALRDAECWVLVAGGPDDRDARRAEAWAGITRDAEALRAWKRAPAGERPAIGYEAAVPADAIWFDPVMLEWCAAGGAARGEGVGELGAYVWQCGRGRAIARLGRLVGVQVITQREHERQVAAVEAVHAA